MNTKDENQKYINGIKRGKKEIIVKFIDEFGEFNSILLNDMNESLKNYTSNPTGFNLRSMIRNEYSVLEGFVCILRDQLLKLDSIYNILTFGEKFILEGNDFRLNDKGKVVQKNKHFPIMINIKFLLKTFEKFSNGDYKPDFRGEGWKNFDLFINTRHRLTHPKKIDDLITPEIIGLENVESLLNGTSWIFDQYKKLQDIFKTLVSP